MAINTGESSQTTDYWLLATDYWLLTTDYWLLATDYWLAGKNSSEWGIKEGERLTVSQLVVGCKHSVVINEVAGEVTEDDAKVLVEEFYAG